MPLVIDIYGYSISIDGPEPAVGGLAEDFAFFKVDRAGADHTLELFEEDPPFKNLPPLMGVVYTPRNVSYQLGDISYIDYSSRALGIHDRKTGNFKLYSRDPDLLYEGAYLFILSQSGEVLDSLGKHRVHALGVAIQGKASLVLLPMGGGKSTLGTYLLKDPAVQLLSDDSPFIDREGMVYAFPLRLGLLPGSESSVPNTALRRINRMEFGPKLLVNYQHFADRVLAKAVPQAIFIGRRSLAQNCEIRTIGKLTALKAMTTNCVVGLGLFQGLEFVLHRSLGEIFFKAATAWSRLRASIALIRKSETYELVLGQNHELNAQTVVEFLVNRSGHKDVVKIPG